MEDINYYTVQGWMVNHLDLSLSETVLYAVLYGFTQSEMQSYTGGINYLTKCCKSSRRTIQRNLQNMEDKGYVQRTVSVIHGKEFIEYRAIVPFQMSAQKKELGKMSPHGQNAQKVGKMTPNNNNIITTTINMTLVEKKEAFKNKMKEVNEKRKEPLPRDEMNKFYAYWTEGNDFNEKAKMRFEKEPHFVVARRMTTWLNNFKKRNKENGKDRL